MSDLVDSQLHTESLTVTPVEVPYRVQLQFKRSHMAILVATMILFSRIGGVTVSGDV